MARLGADTQPTRTRRLNTQIDDKQREDTGCVSGTWVGPRYGWEAVALFCIPMALGGGMILWELWKP